MMKDRQSRIAGRRRISNWMDMFHARYDGLSRYASCIQSIKSPDTASTILVEIPAYDDSEILNTVQSAIVCAACPERIRFAVCLQDDSMFKLDRLLMVPGCRVKYYPKAAAPGTCRARYDCQQLLDGEDFVMHVDAHVRFAMGWDIFFIDQWRRCGTDLAVLSMPGIGVTPENMSVLFDDPMFVSGCSGHSLVLIPHHFSGSPCSLVIGTKWAGGQTYEPEAGAFMAAGIVFASSRFDMDVPVDPEMNFSGDEQPVVIRAWEKGFRFFHPAMECVYHLHDINRHNSSYRAGDGWQERQSRQTARYENLLGLRHDIDLGSFGLMDMSSLQQYEEFAGVCFKDMSITDASRDGRFGTRS